MSEPMICLVGNRRSGKTSALIKLSAATGLPIYTATREMADHIKAQAIYFGQDIPEPRCREFIGDRCHDPILVDEAQAILERVYGRPVSVASFDARIFDFSSMGLLEVISTWFKNRRVKKVFEDDLNT